MGYVKFVRREDQRENIRTHILKDIMQENMDMVGIIDKCHPVTDDCAEQDRAVQQQGEISCQWIFRTSALELPVST